MQSSAQSSQDPTVFAVILAGGSGTRFWPASRAARPKQYLPIAGGQPMISATLARLEGLVAPEQVLVVTAQTQLSEVRRCLPNLPPENILAEPLGRNTAPCIAWASLELARRVPHSVQLVLPADHLIQPDESFRASLRAGAHEAAQSGALLTFGIQPNHPATGYGYIEAGDLLHQCEGQAVHRVARFVEKPSLERAREFLASGRFLWNAGIFAWRTDAILDAFRQHLPGALVPLEKLAGVPPSAELYSQLPSVPVDIAILERARNVRVLPIDYRWNDVGSWSALSEIGPPLLDGHWGTLADGAQLVSLDSKQCVLYAEGPEVVAVVGVENLIVVRAGNATLVCARDRAQDVKKVVEELQRRHLHHHL